MTTQWLSPLDLAFLCLEDRMAPMHLGAVAVFDPPSPARLAAVLRQRAATVPRFRQRVRGSWLPPGGAVWVEDPTFDVGEHIHSHRLSAAGLDDLAALVGPLMAEPLDLTQPLWQLHLVTGLAGGRFAIVAKLHHALCDGYGAIGLGMGLLDGIYPQDGTVRRAARPAPSRAVTGSGADRLSWPYQLLRAGIRTTADIASRAHTALSIGCAALAQVEPHAAAPLRAAPSRSRRAVLARLDIKDLQRIRGRHGGTIHDVLLAVLSGALRRWLAAGGHPVDQLRPRALIPASQRRPKHHDTGGNQLSGYLCDLPVAEPDVGTALQSIRNTMARNKAHGPRRGAGALPVLADQLPHLVHRFATPLAAHAAPLLFDLVVTTVSLPAAPLWLAGAQLRELYPLVPLARGHALAVALSRYRDSVHIGLHANGDALPDIDKLADALPSVIASLDE